MILGEHTLPSCALPSSAKTGKNDDNIIVTTQVPKIESLSH